MTDPRREADAQPPVGPQPAAKRKHAGGRPRSDAVNKAILYAAREELVEHGFTRLRLEHVAARAGVGKATLYRRWGSKEALAEDLLAELAAPHIAVVETGDTRDELRQCVQLALHAIRDTPFGAVIRALLSQIAVNPRLGDPFRATVVHARRSEIARVVARGIARGHLRPDCAADVATELLIGPVYFRLLFGGDMRDAFATEVADAVWASFAIQEGSTR